MCGNPTSGKPGTLQQRCTFLCPRSPSGQGSFRGIARSFASVTSGSGRPWSARLYAGPDGTPSASPVAWSPGQRQDYLLSTTGGGRARSSEPRTCAPGTHSHGVRVVTWCVQTTVFDAADFHTESTFWAAIVGPHAFEPDDPHSVIDAAGDCSTRGGRRSRARRSRPATGSSAREAVSTPAGGESGRSAVCPRDPAMVPRASPGLGKASDHVMSCSWALADSRAGAWVEAPGVVGML